MLGLFFFLSNRGVGGRGDTATKIFCRRARSLRWSHVRSRAASSPGVSLGFPGFWWERARSQHLEALAPKVRSLFLRTQLVFWPSRLSCHSSVDPHRTCESLRITTDVMWTRRSTDVLGSHKNLITLFGCQETEMCWSIVKRNLESNDSHINPPQNHHSPPSESQRIKRSIFEVSRQENLVSTACLPFFSRNRPERPKRNLVNGKNWSEPKFGRTASRFVEWSIWWRSDRLVYVCWKNSRRSGD